MSFPKIITSTVVRASQKGEAHGAVYLIDTEKEIVDKVIDYQAIDLDWTGRGGERGLRGIAFYKNRVYLAAHDRILIYNTAFMHIGNIENQYFGQIHEIMICEDRLYITSTSFDSIIIFNLKKMEFELSFCVRSLSNKLKKKNFWFFSKQFQWGIRKTWMRMFKYRPKARVFDPNSNIGPERNDLFHLNSVWHLDKTTYFSGGRFNYILSCKDARIFNEVKINFGTHNTMPFENGFLYNDTGIGRILYRDVSGVEKLALDIQRYPDSKLINSDLPDQIAKPYFYRGLCKFDGNYIIGGYSPASIVVFDINGNFIKNIMISYDIRQAIHGLEIWPYS